MNLFIDSNILLEFYHFSRDDLEELKKLVSLIEKGEVRLYVTRQVINEIMRNRDGKVADALNRFRDSKVEIQMPQICKSYPEYEIIKKMLMELKKSKSELDEKLISDIGTKTLTADKTIEDLKQKANIVESDGYIEKAISRQKLGNPPGKKDSYGDAVNWEALISVVPDSQDLFFISGDKDYRSPLGEGRFNSYLDFEWHERKKSSILFYTKLSEFFRHHYNDIKLKTEEEKESLIEHLTLCASFRDAHLLIKELSKFDGFSDSQIKRLIETATRNSQIYWIARDPEIKNFFNWVIQGKEDIIDGITLALYKLYFLGIGSHVDHIEQSDDEKSGF
jgi:hypothetical protein